MIGWSFGSRTDINWPRDGCLANYEVSCRQVQPHETVLVEDMIWASLYVAGAAVLCVLVIVAMLTITYVYHLSGARAILNDGLARGSAAPAWGLADSSGKAMRSPPVGKPFQLIVFGEHSLRSFPSVAEGLRDLLRNAPDLEIVVLTRGQAHLTGPMLSLLGLGQIPVVAGLTFALWPVQRPRDAFRDIRGLSWAGTRIQPGESCVAGREALAGRPAASRRG